MLIPTNVMRRAREEAHLKQTDIAAKLAVSASVISRLEKTELTDDVMARRYLEAVASPLSQEIIEFYGRSWQLTERPSFFHPNRDSLWSAELALQRLKKFKSSDAYEALLDVPLGQIKSSLESSVSFIFRLDHSMAWIGSVGVGKTTALSLLTDLVIEGKSGHPQPIFPATGGRTTISEVVVRVAPAYGIAVEAMDEDSVRLLVSDLIIGMARGEGGLSTELERAIRNMSDLRRGKDEARGSFDPIRDLVDQEGREVDDVIEEIMSRINIAGRTETQLILSENTEDGLRWLSENVTKINFGQHPKFSLPERIVVFVPSIALRESPYDLSVIDTKGIHGTTLRQDLRTHLDDPRTVSILCSNFNDAPNGDILKIMRELKSLGSDALEKQRVVVLILPRGDEAMKVVDEQGEYPERPEDGYEIRAQQVEDTIRSEGLAGVQTVFFNAMTDSSSIVWKKLGSYLENLRHRQLDRLERLVDVSNDLVTNADAAKIQQARVTISKEIALMIEAYRRPGPLVRPAHQNLIEELESGHASSIAAAVNRRGSWPNFPMHHMMGVGVRIDANLRTTAIFTKIDGRLEGLSQKFSNIPEIVAIIESLKENLGEWRQEFLARAIIIGRVTFKPYLDSASELWESLGVYWGKGSGYRAKVVSEVKEWFEQNENLADARRRVEGRLREAWQELVVARLAEAALMSDQKKDD